MKMPACTAPPHVPVEALYEAFAAGFLHSVEGFNGEMGPIEESFRVMFEEWRTGKPAPPTCGKAPAPRPDRWRSHRCDRVRGHAPPCEWEGDPPRQTGSGGPRVERDDDES